MNSTEEIKELGKQLTATTIEDTGRLESIITRLSELKADYNPEIVECEVEFSNDDSQELIFVYGNNEEYGLEECVACKDWHGLRWSDGSITDANDTLITFRKIINGKLEWPTHVLMKEVSRWNVNTTRNL